MLVEGLSEAFYSYNNPKFKFFFNSILKIILKLIQNLRAKVLFIMGDKESNLFDIKSIEIGLFEKKLFFFF